MEKVNILKITTFLLILVLFSAGCDKNNIVGISGVTLSQNTLALTTGDKETLTVTVLPDDAADK
jgi:uncharacterized protein YjdB